MLPSPRLAIGEMTFQIFESDQKMNKNISVEI